MRDDSMTVQEVQEIQVAKRGKPVISPDVIATATFKDHEKEVITVLLELQGEHAKNDVWFLSGIGISKGEVAQVSSTTRKALEQFHETLAIMSDSEFMESIRKGSEDIKAGRVHKFSDLLHKHELD
jgi:hypothetical protein